MTPSTRALLARFRRRAAALEPDLRRAWLRGFERLSQEIPEAQLVRLLQSGSVEQLVAGLFTPEAVEEAFAAFRVTVREGLAAGTAAFARDLPKVPGIQFDVLSPHVVTAIRELDTRVMAGIVADLQGTVRQVVTAGLEAGDAPTAIARRLRAVLPLAPNQEAAIRNFERMLRTGDREALTRALRDRRFDTTIRRSFAGDGLTRDQVARMVAGYRRKMVAFNASTHARTAAVDAMKRGQALAWQAAIDAGTVDGERLRKEWVTVGDDRVRPEHVEMNGQVVPADQLYSNGEMVPGSSTFNCRCVSRFFLARLDRAA